MSKVMYKGNPIQKGGSAASEVLFDKSAVSDLGIEATNVQELIDYLLKLAGDLKTELDDKFIIRTGLTATVSGDGYSTSIQKSALKLKDGINLSDYKWMATTSGGDTNQFYEWDHIATLVTAHTSELSIRTWMFANRSSSQEGDLVCLKQNMNFIYDVVGIKIS